MIGKELIEYPIPLKLLRTPKLVARLHSGLRLEAPRPRGRLRVRLRLTVESPIRRGMIQP